MTLGIVQLGYFIARRIRKGNTEPIDVMAACIIVVGLISSALYVLAAVGSVHFSVIRILGWVLALLGLSWLWRWTPRLMEFWREFRGVLFTMTLMEKTTIGLLFMIAIGLLGASLGPATDGDSLHYHLAAPLEWLRTGGITVRSDWYSYRFAGVSHSLNMFGVASGTDSFGAVLQCFGLAVVGVGTAQLARKREDKLFTLLLIMACPVIVSLTSTQKFHLLPAAATTTALVLAHARIKSFDIPSMVLAFCCLAFALGSKYFFAISGTMVFCYCMFAARCTGNLRIAVLIACVAFLVLASPLYITNWVLHGDPVWPMGAVLQGQDQNLIGFVDNLKLSSDTGTPSTLPTDLVFPRRLGALAQVLGVGSFAFVLGLRNKHAVPSLLFLALATSVFVYLARTQFTSRYFIEMYWWSAAAISCVDWTWRKRWLQRAMLAQSALVAVLALYGAYALFPGALSTGLRKSVLIERAFGYASAQWINSKVSDTSAVFVVPGNVSYAHLAVPFHNFDGWEYANDYRSQDQIEGVVEEIIFTLSESELDTLFTNYPVYDPAIRYISECFSNQAGIVQGFSVATRNPFNKSNKSMYQLLPIDVTRSQCD